MGAARSYESDETVDLQGGLHVILYLAEAPQTSELVSLKDEPTGIMGHQVALPCRQASNARRHWSRVNDVAAFVSRCYSFLPWFALCSCSWCQQQVKPCKPTQVRAARVPHKVRTSHRRHQQAIQKFQKGEPPNAL